VVLVLLRRNDIGEFSVRVAPLRDSDY
jgi:hypothetical protein